MYVHIWKVKPFAAYETHCYGPTYREKIREIMRYGGPKMLFVSPIQVIKHMYLEWKDKKEGIQHC